MFQLDDSKYLYRKWLFHQTSIYKWLFGVPGIPIQIAHEENTPTSPLSQEVQPLGPVVVSVPPSKGFGEPRW